MWVIGNVLAIYATVMLVVRDNGSSSLVVLGFAGIAFKAISVGSRRARMHH